MQRNEGGRVPPEQASAVASVLASVSGAGRGGVACREHQQHT